MRKYMKVSVLVDNPKSWFNKYLAALFKLIKKYDPDFLFYREASKLKRGDIVFILSCDRIMTRKQLSFHKHNIVVHASDLPLGRGWSPLTWQVEGGKNRIPITLFEAAPECDAGDYYIKDYIQLDGTELIDEIRRKQAEKTIELIRRYLSGYPCEAMPQRGKITHYRKRKQGDNELNINKSIKSQFNKMRIADNVRYPLNFRYKNKKYILKIYCG